MSCGRDRIQPGLRHFVFVLKTACISPSAVLIYPSSADICSCSKDTFGRQNGCRKAAADKDEMSAEYYVVRKRAVPEVLQKVVEVNRLLSSGSAKTVAEAAAAAGISRSSYYKFKDDIEEFHDRFAGKTLTLSLDVTDESGVLSGILRVIAENGANILTIHQSVPAGGAAAVSISVQLSEHTEDASGLLESLKELHGVRKISITG